MPETTSSDSVQLRKIRCAAASVSGNPGNMTTLSGVEFGEK